MEAEEEEEEEEEEEDDDEEEEEGTDPIGFRGLNAARLCSNLNKMCLGWSPCLAPPPSQILLRAHYVPALLRASSITCPLRARLT